MARCLRLMNARLVLPQEVVEGGLVIADGRIDDILPAGKRVEDGVDLSGDYLLPGLVEPHTDNLEPIPAAAHGALAGACGEPGP